MFIFTMIEKEHASIVCKSMKLLDDLSNLITCIYQLVQVLVNFSKDHQIDSFLNIVFFP